MTSRDSTSPCQKSSSEAVQALHRYIESQLASDKGDCRATQELVDLVGDIHGASDDKQHEQYKCDVLKQVLTACNRPKTPYRRAKSVEISTQTNDDNDDGGACAAVNTTITTTDDKPLTQNDTKTEEAMIECALRDIEEQIAALTLAMKSISTEHSAVEDTSKANDQLGDSGYVDLPAVCDKEKHDDTDGCNAKLQTMEQKIEALKQEVKELKEAGSSDNRKLQKRHSEGELVRSNFTGLVKGMEMNDMLDVLFEKEVITRSTYEQLRGLARPDQARQLLLQLLREDQPHKFQGLRDALEAVEQEHLADTITPDVSPNM